LFQIEIFGLQGGSAVQRVAVISLILLVFTSLAAAQVPSGNVYFGYSYVNAPLVTTSNVSLNGWNGSLEGKFLPWIGLVADIGGYYGSQTKPGVAHVNGNIYSFLGGPRVSVSVGKFRPFAHALLGAGHTSSSGGGYSASDTSFSDALGGGLDYKIIKGLAWRGQLDLLQTRFYGRDQNSLRFSTGIVIHF
jgi:hypothetical protein